MLPVYPFVGLLITTSVRHFFYQPPTLLRRSVNVCKLRVHCHDVCNITPPPCISANSVKIPLNFIMFNVHKTVVSYETVQSFCSDVVAQNINVILHLLVRFYVSKNSIVFHQSNVLC